MKKITFLLIFTLVSSTLMAQTNKDSGIFLSTGVSYGGAVGKIEQTYTAHSLDIEFGYQLTDRIGIHLPVSASINLFDYDKTTIKDYTYNGEVGAGLNVTIIKFRESSRIDVKAQYGVSIADHWRYSYYDFSAIWSFGGPYLGVGYRYQDTFRGDYGCYSGFYATFGYKIFRHISKR